MGTSGDSTRAIGQGYPPIDCLGPDAATPAGFSVPWWQLQQAWQGHDTFSRQTPQQAARLTEAPDAGLSKFQAQLDRWMAKHPDLKKLLDDIQAKRQGLGLDEAVAQQADGQKAPHKKRKRQAGAPLIGETDFSCKTSNGKEPHKAALYGQDEEDSGVEEGSASEEDYSSGSSGGGYDMPQGDDNSTGPSASAMDEGHYDSGGEEPNFGGYGDDSAFFAPSQDSEPVMSDGLSLD